MSWLPMMPVTPRVQLTHEQQEALRREQERKPGYALQVQRALVYENQFNRADPLGMRDYDAKAEQRRSAWCACPFALSFNTLLKIKSEVGFDRGTL